MPSTGVKESYLTVQLREKGVSPEQVDRNRDFDGQARINFLFGNEPIPESIQDPARHDALSIRLDREGRIEEKGRIRFDDTLLGGEVSLDAGTLSGGNQASDSYLLGKIVAIGNAIDVGLSASQKTPQYYHNRESFSKELGRADVFAELVKLIRRSMTERYSFTVQGQAEAA
ncbi:MAG: hypothetical protein V1668_02665 [Patescibacteria group bacterium]